MTGPICVRCARPLADGAYCCDRCAAQAAHKLAEIAELSPPCRDVANGLSRRNGAGASGKPGSRLPLDLTAMAKLDGVQNELTTWARHVAGERSGVDWWPTGPGDVIVWAAVYLGANVEWMRHRPEADEFLTDVEACLRIVRSIARGPAEQKYLGPCGAPVTELDEIIDEYGEDRSVGLIANHCDGDVYAREGASDGSCRLCGTKWSTAERAVWLDGVARSWLYHASEIEDAYPKIKANTIRAWLSRGLLVAHGEHDGRPLLKLGDVLDLAAGDAARREEARAKRERRAADKAEESERVA